MKILEEQLKKRIQPLEPLQKDTVIECVNELLKNRARPTNSMEYLFNLVKSVHVSFERNKRRQTDISILSCIRGFMQGAEDHFLYWRIHGQWYEVKQDLISQAHQTFIYFLNSKGYLLTDKDVEFSKNRWLGKTKEIYLRKERSKNTKAMEKLNSEAIFNAYFGYKNKGRFIVGDKICLDGIELFDVMEIRKKGNAGKAIYLYHVKRGLNTATREACAQIQNASRIITNPSKANFKELEKFYERIKANPVNRRNEKVFVFRKICSTFTKSKIYLRFFRQFDKRS